MRYDPPDAISPVAAPGQWRHLVRVKHVFTTDSDALSIGQSMNDIADILEKDCWFDYFLALPRFRDEDDVEAANELLDELYDYCDARGIWLH